MRFRTNRAKSNFRCGFYIFPKSPKKQNKISAYCLVLRKKGHKTTLIHIISFRSHKLLNDSQRTQKLNSCVET